jgi:tetratricopeptide (TPR) repeat protein
MKIFVFLFLFLASGQTVYAQGGGSASQLTPAQTTALDEAKKLNDELITLFQQKKFGDALKLGVRIQTLIDTNGLVEDPNALTMLSNVSEVMLAQGKESDAIALFQRILVTYQKLLGRESLLEAQTTERIARAFFEKKDYSQATEYELRTLAIYEKRSGTAATKIADNYLLLGEMYRLDNKPGQAETAYRKAIDLTDGAMTDTERASRTDIYLYTCFLYQAELGGERLTEATMAKISEFRQRRSEINAARHPAKTTTVVEAGVINWKAKRLPPPMYPRNVPMESGFAAVEVVIDETGKVIKARGSCGARGFFRSSEAAALNAEFAPTLRNGVPVKVTGVIIYRFFTRTFVTR